MRERFFVASLIMDERYVRSSNGRAVLCIKRNLVFVFQDEVNDNRGQTGSNQIVTLFREYRNRLQP